MQWEVSRRYKEFHRLHEQLQKKMVKKKELMYLPHLPPKRAITPKNGAFVSKRQMQLEMYLQDLVSLPCMAEDIDVMSFLGGNGLFFSCVYLLF